MNRAEYETILKDAIQGEIEAQKFYQDVADRMADVFLKELFSDAFALAMKNEEAAMNHYTALADGCTDSRQKQIFMELAAMEREHKFKMESAFVDIGYPEVW